MKKKIPPMAHHEVNNTFIIHQQNELEPYSNDIVSIWKILRNPGMILMAFQRKNRQKRRQRSSLLFGGQNSLNSLPHYRFSTRMNMKNRRKDAWQNGAKKMDDHLVHTTPNHLPPNMDVLQKPFLQIILAAKWLVQHSSSFSNISDDLCLLFCLFLPYDF